MTPDSLQKEMGEAVPRLLKMAKELTWNNLSNNCRFILSEERSSERSLFDQRQLRKKENDQKAPVMLQELVPILQNFYSDLYDINLYIYKAEKNMTIIEARYFLKSSLEEGYRQQVINNPPMLHCKVSMPPWHADKKEKFDINWEHNTGWNKWKLFWLKQKLKLKSS